MAKYSEAHRIAKNKWRNNNYQYSSVFPIEYKEYIQTRGAEYGSVSQYLLHLIISDMKERGEDIG